MISEHEGHNPAESPQGGEPVGEHSRSSLVCFQSDDEGSEETDFGDDDIELDAPPPSFDRYNQTRMLMRGSIAVSRRVQETPIERKRASQRLSSLGSFPGLAAPQAKRLEDTVWIGYFVDLLERLKGGRKQGSDDLRKELTNMLNNEAARGVNRVALIAQATNDVAREQLLSSVHEDICRFWKLCKEPSWCTNLKESLRARSEQILRWKREALCLKVEVDNWLLRYRLRRVKTKECEETQDERRHRLEDFWAEYHVVSKKQDQLPTLPSKPSSPSKGTGLRSQVQSARMGELCAHQSLWLAPDNDEECDLDSDARPTSRGSPVSDLMRRATATANRQDPYAACANARTLAGSTSLPNLTTKSKPNPFKQKAHGSQTSPLPAIGPPASSTKRYLQVCHNNAVVPTPMPFVTGHSLRLSAEGKALVDKDLIAVAMMVRGMRKVEEVDLAGNTLLTERSLLPFVRTLFGKPASSSLKRLNLSRCTHAGTCALQAGQSTLHVVASLLAAPDGAQKLKILDISGIPMSMPCQLAMSDAVRGHSSLSSLNLADVGLGRTSSQAAKQCIGAILGSRSLRTLDLGWNCFNAEVFAHIGEQVTETMLSSLSVANSSSSSISAASLPAAFSSASVRFQAGDCPVMFFIEHLHRDKSLTQLDVSMNRIDFRGALVIEDALENHKAMSELKVSHNPLGVLGIRSMLRLLSKDYSSLGHFNCDGCSDGTMPEGDDSTQVFSATNPGGRYRLDFSRPYHRSLLRMLYKTCQRFKLQPGDAFTTIACSPDLKAFSHVSMSPDGTWALPTAGTLTTVFTIEKAMEAAISGVDVSDFSTFLHRHYSTVRMRAGFKKEVPLFAQWKMLDGQFHEQSVLLEAISKDFTLTVPEIEMMCQTRAQTGDIICRLMHCVDGGETARYLTMMQTPSLGEFFRIRNQIRSLMEFNVENPTGHYRLDLGNACDFAVAERLLLIDRWEQGISRTLGHADTSQTGNASNARNERHMDLPLLSSWEIGSIAEWNAPEHGVFELDYLSGKRPPATATILDKATFNGILCTLQQSATSPQDEIEILRMVSNWMYVSAFQVRELLGLYRSEHDRCEIFVLLFQRIVDIYNEKICRVRFNSFGELQGLRNRIGHTTYFPFIQPEHTQFEFDFSVHDQRLACNLLILVASKEHLTNIKKESITYMKMMPSGALEEDPLPQGIPMSWYTFSNMPRAGTFKCSYNCAPEHRNLPFRNSLLETYGYWPPAPDETEWWAALSDAPSDLILFLEFVVGQFSSLGKAFRAIDGPGGNHLITWRVFENAYKALGCHKFDGPNEKERLLTVFRYLDPGGEGSISEEEWGALAMFWNELQLSMQEFVRFLQRTFGDGDTTDKEILEAAWEYIDEDKSNSIEKDEWTHMVQERLKYFGPSEVIFHYMDKDDSGDVSLDEFMLLETYLLHPFVVGRRDTVV